jgi:hypothetical protein
MSEHDPAMTECQAVSRRQGKQFLYGFPSIRCQRLDKPARSESAREHVIHDASIAITQTERDGRRLLRAMLAPEIA